MRLYAVIAASCVAAALAGCAGAVREPTPADARAADARWPGTTLGELREGRRLYVATCAGCHTLRDPASLPPEAWDKQVDEMRGKQGVHLDARGARLIARYLSAMSFTARARPSR